MIDCPMCSNTAYEGEEPIPVCKKHYDEFREHFSSGDMTEDFLAGQYFNRLFKVIENDNAS